MKSERISLTITEICQKLGLDYQSCNKAYIDMVNDAKRLGEISLDLVSLIDELDAILKRHNINNGIKAIFEKDFEKLHQIDHDIVKLSKKIQKEKND